MELALPPDPSTLDRPMTVEEWLQLPEGPPYLELIDGELVVNQGNRPVTVRVLELVEDTYIEQEPPGGNESTFSATTPFPVTLDPARLLD